MFDKRFYDKVQFSILNNIDYNLICKKPHACDCPDCQVDVYKKAKT